MTCSRLEELQQQPQLWCAKPEVLVGFAFVIELQGLNGRFALPEEVPVESLIVYP